MSKEELLRVITSYKEYFGYLTIEKEPIAFDVLADCLSQTKLMGHCAYMIDQMEEFVNKGEEEKAHRWLGFIQGCMWTLGRSTIDELRELNVGN